MPAPKPYLCKYCGTTDLSRFFKQSKMKSCCLKCHTFQTHHKKRLIKLKGIEYLGGKCERCNLTGVPAIFDFHHRNPKEKEFGWSSVRTSNWERFKKELDKCMLLCSNCHREVHDQIWFESLPEHHPEKIRRTSES